MKTIKFGHKYQKFSYGDGNLPGFAKLIEVFSIKLEEISPLLIQYDTETQDGRNYRLPAKGEYLLLIFQVNPRHIFTTMRREYPSKKKYYKNSIGEVFRLEVSGE